MKPRAPVLLWISPSFWLLPGLLARPQRASLSAIALEPGLAP